MSDADAREWERRWRADPGDLEALERAIALRRRTGETVPWTLLEARRQPPRAISCPARLDVFAVLPAGKIHKAGRTPGRVQLPRHRRWWVHPLTTPTKDSVPELVGALAELEVEGLRLPAARLSNRALLEPLQALDRLSLLDLSVCEGLSAPGLKFLAALPRLEAIALGRTEFLSYLDALSPCPLTCVALIDAPVTERGLANLVAFPGLTALELQGSSMTPEVLAALDAMPDLEWIRLGFGALSEGLGHLPSRLRHLSLAWTDVVADDMRALTRLEGLETLELSGCKSLSPFGLGHLAALPRLRSLDLRGCERIRDPSPLFDGFPALTHLDLRATAVPAREVERLSKRRPELLLRA